jgi:hypothetical protein
MASVVQQRKQLKREIRERRKDVIPRLKAAIRNAEKARKQRLRKCKADCRAAIRRERKRAAQARKKLEQHIRKAQSRAKDVCKSCKVVDEKGVESISKALEALATEREEINKLRTQASYLKSERGRAGGRKAAEIRSESDSAVIHNLGEDKELISLFKKVRGKIKPSKYQSRTEAFLQYVHDHSEALDELRAKAEQKYAAEAERLFRERQPEANGNGCWDDLGKCQRELAELKAAERFLSEAEKDLPF